MKRDITKDDVHYYVADMLEIMPYPFLLELICTHEDLLEDITEKLEYLGEIEGLGGERYLQALERHKQLHDIYNKYFKGVLDDN